MTEQDAQRLGAKVLDAGLDAQVYQIGNQEYVCRIKPQDFWLWSHSDLTVYAHDLKHQKKKQRQADRAQHGIDPQEQYRLALFA